MSDRQGDHSKEQHLLHSMKGKNLLGSSWRVLKFKDQRSCWKGLGIENLGTGVWKEDCCFRKPFLRTVERDDTRKRFACRKSSVNDNWKFLQMGEEGRRAKIRSLLVPGEEA